MAVQVWIGEKPEHPNERRAIVALANGLERLEGLYLLLANFSVGGRAIDLVIVKQDAVFILELKHCDGQIFGDVNGPWYVESANGTRKRLNPGRKNPYNQVISYYYSLVNFLNERRGDFLSPNKAASTDFRTCRRVVVIAPTLQEGSKVEIDWKVELKGLDELPAYLVTERSSEIELTEEEMLQIPELLHLMRWNEVNALMAGVMRWDEPVPASPPEPTLEPVAPVVAEVAVPVAPPTFRERAKQLTSTWSGRIAIAAVAVACVLALLLVFRQPQVARIDQPSGPLVSTTEAGPAAGGVGPGGLGSGASCVWSEYQSVGRRVGAQSGTWTNVGVIGNAPASSPDVVVTLEEVSFCDNRITLSWSLQNNTDDLTVKLPLTASNILIRDEHGTEYTVSDGQSQPVEMEAAPHGQIRGTAIIDRNVSLNASTLRITLKNQPFGEAVWIVPVSGN